MKKLYFLFFIVSAFCSAQTTLVPGDIAVFQNQADAPDDFAFVTFVNIDAGTGIYFTDCGTSTTGFRTPVCTEGALKYTVPAGGLNAGDMIRWSTNVTNFVNYSDTRITGTGGPALATSGDQVVVFQDATSAAGGTDAANTPTFLFVLHNASTQFLGDPTDSNETSLPPGLSDTGLPRTAVGVGAGAGVDVEWDDTVYNGTYDFSGFSDLASSIAAAKVAMTDPANYTQVNNIFDASYASAVAAIPNALMLFTLSTEEFSLDSALSLYPNPSNGITTIKNNGIILNAVNITDVNGRTIVSQDLNGTTTNITLDLTSKLSSGLYFVSISSNKGTIAKKLIIE